MAQTIPPNQLASVTARDGADTRTKENSTETAVNVEEAIRLGTGVQVRGGQTAAMTHIIRDSDSIFEDMVDVEYDAFQNALEDLVDISYLTKEVDDNDDRTYFRAREGLSWSEIVRFDCPVKKQILLCLIDNPHTFFVLYNTQKGKLRIAAEEIREWATIAQKKVVGFLLVDNDKTLADQTTDGVLSIIESVADIYLLSSNSGDTMDSIKYRIDSYAAFGGKMPVIVALNNAKQIKKITGLMKHIQERMVSGQCPTLRYGVVFDEADKIYPASRAQFLPLLVEDDRALHRLGFVTATEGDLMDADYPECANAYMYPVPAGNPDYRAIHTEDAIIKHVPQRVRDSNDVYAERILAEHADYFTQKVTLKNGTQGFRKVIVNGGAKTVSMDGFARNRVAENAYAITVNMMGVNVYRPEHEKKRYSAKGVRFGQLLFTIYKELGLHDKPLYVIGRRKVDRGLGFHFAPREGPLDGLIFTDMILGRVDDKATAVQKAGRLAGVVAQCPQYCGNLTWWTDERTSQSVTHHNEIVDVSNTKRGCSALQAMTRGAAAVSPPRSVSDDDNFDVEWHTFDTYEQAKAFAPRVQLSKKVDEDGFIMSAIDKKAARLSYDDVTSKLRRFKKTAGFDVRKLEIGKSTCTMYVCYRDLDDKNSTAFVVGKLTRLA